MTDTDTIRFTECSDGQMRAYLGDGSVLTLGEIKLGGAMGEKTFPIHSTHQHLLRSVPWDLVKRHEAQCLKNHGQTPEELASRGGLSLCELIAVLQDRRYTPMNDGDALRLVHERIAQGR